MAGVAGLEPTNGGIKTRCLTNLAIPQLFGYGLLDGWGSRTRTYEWRDQNPLPYQLGYTPVVYNDGAEGET